jgi:adenylate cyclase, class 2
VAQEFETQVLEADVAKISDILRKSGAKEEDEILQKRWVYYISNDEWIRLREAGERIEITYKNRKSTGISDTEEVEILTDDFDKSAELLDRLSFFTEKYYQENRRKKFVLNDIEYTLDTWPQLPTILEVEAKSEEKVHEGLALLELTGKDIGHEGMNRIYKKYGIELHDMPELKF